MVVELEGMKRRMKIDFLWFLFGCLKATFTCFVDFICFMF